MFSWSCYVKTLIAALLTISQQSNCEEYRISLKISNDLDSAVISFEGGGVLCWKGKNVVDLTKSSVGVCRDQLHHSAGWQVPGRSASHPGDACVLSREAVRPEAAGGVVQESLRHSRPDAVRHYRRFRSRHRPASGQGKIMIIVCYTTRWIISMIIHCY